MNTKIFWFVQDMQHIVSNGDVISVDWICTAQGGGASAKYFGKSEFAPDASNANFIPYDQLTEESVLQWVFEELDDKKAAIEASCLESLKRQLNLATNSGLPWLNDESGE
jgi:DNA polymerase III delta subunit